MNFNLQVSCKFDEASICLRGPTQKHATVLAFIGMHAIYVILTLRQAFLNFIISARPAKPCRSLAPSPKCVPDAGSTQGIGLGMLQGLARAGADVVMHGLVTPEEARQKQAEIEGEYGVKCGHSAANVMKPAEIRY